MAANRIVVDDNTKEYEVVNKKGKVLGAFFINPTDFNISKRADEVLGHIDGIISGMHGNDGATDEETMKALDEASETIKREIDYIFDGNASETFFSTTNPFSLVDGKFYIENVIVAIQAVIKKEFGKEVEKSRKRMSRHTGKYKKQPDIGTRKGSLVAMPAREVPVPDEGQEHEGDE